MPGYADEANWLEVGLLVYRRRIELRITSQKAFAERAGVHVNTISRLERGIPSSRRNPSWPAIERVLGWPEGHIASMVEGRVQEPEPVPFAATLEQAVMESLRESLPDVTFRQAHTVARGVLARLERRGLLPGSRPSRG